MSARLVAMEANHYEMRHFGTFQSVPSSELSYMGYDRTKKRSIPILLIPEQLSV